MGEVILEQRLSDREAMQMRDQKRRGVRGRQEGKKKGKK
jgi:hypothetical protein